jgi:hypothetical protein
MNEISPPTWASFLSSPRTADYVSAMIREGDNFDYYRWLQEARAEETQAKQRPQTTTSGKIRAVEIDPPIGTPDCRKASPNRTRLARPMPGGVPRSYRQPVRSTSVTRITRRLEKIRDPWDDFQASRARDAVYGYLEAVFELVMHYKVRRKTKTLLRHAFKFAELPFDRNADPFSAVIRCTSDDHADSKAISKWARALRYVARCKERGTPLKVFMKEAGGVNACASLYARRGKRDNRRSPRDRTNQLAC